MGNGWRRIEKRKEKRGWITDVELSKGGRCGMEEERKGGEEERRRGGEEERRRGKERRIGGG